MEQKTNWNSTDNRFVAFLDILGFKDMVMRSSHIDIYKKLESISKEKDLLENITTLGSNDVNKKVGNGEIYTVSFSDSITIFSKTDDIDNFQFFLVSVRWFIAKAIENSIPIKGGISYGEISVNKSKQIYFGQPIIDAYLMEQDVNYLGVVSHFSVDKFINDNIDKLDMNFINQNLFDCLTPLKSGLIEHKNIDWFRKINKSISTKDKENKKREIEKVINEFKMTCSGSPRKYIDNTLQVFNKRIESW